jgi:hypothetical protein
VRLHSFEIRGLPYRLKSNCRGTALDARREVAVEDCKNIVQIAGVNPTGLTIIAVGLFAILMSVFYARDLGAYQLQLLTAGGLGFTALGTIILIYDYLQESRRSSPAAYNEIEPEISRLQEAIDKLAADRPAASFELTPEERRSLLEAIKAETSKDTLEQLSSLWREEFAERDGDQTLRRIRADVVRALVNRLRDEIYALGKRASLNLAIGIAISGIGLFILTWFVYSATADLSLHVNAADAALRFSIRFSKCNLRRRSRLPWPNTRIRPNLLETACASIPSCWQV